MCVAFEWLRGKRRTVGVKGTLKQKAHDVMFFKTTEQKAWCLKVHKTRQTESKSTASDLTVREVGMFLVCFSRKGKQKE